MSITNYLAPDLSDDFLTVVSGETYWLALHTGNPDGPAGLLEGTGLPRIELDPLQWAAAVDHPTSGRMLVYTPELSFGVSTANETYTFAVLWTAFAIGAVRAVKQLETPIIITVDSTLTIPAGNMRFRAGSF